MLRIVQLGIGLIGVFVLDLRGDGTPMLRTASPVRDIRFLEGPAEAPGR